MLKINSVNKTFNKNTPDQHKGLDNLNLNVSEGEFVTIIGGNGAGKSTLFNVISGSMLCDSGMIELGGEDITYEPEHSRASFIGRIFQDPMKGTAPNMTVGENLIIAYMRSAKKSIMKYPSKKDKMFIREHLAELGLGLEDRMNTKIGLLSGGQRQAITLTMATLVKPKLLLLDEHTAALDPKTSRLIMEKTQELIKSHAITTMMISHNVRDALKYSDRIIMLDKGSVVLDVRNGDITEKELVSIYNSRHFDSSLREAV